VKSEQIISMYLAALGQKGGKATGAAKRRGGTAYYRELSKRGVAARQAGRRKAKDQIEYPRMLAAYERKLAANRNGPRVSQYLDSIRHIREALGMPPYRARK
jgi:hypothetical protein